MVLGLERLLRLRPGGLRRRRRVGWRWPRRLALCSARCRWRLRGRQTRHWVETPEQVGLRVRVLPGPDHGLRPGRLLEDGLQLRARANSDGEKPRGVCEGAGGHLLMRVSKRSRKLKVLWQRKSAQGRAAPDVTSTAGPRRQISEGGRGTRTSAAAASAYIRAGSRAQAPPPGAPPASRAPSRARACRLPRPSRTPTRPMWRERSRRARRIRATWQICACPPSAGPKLRNLRLPATPVLVGTCERVV